MELCKRASALNVVLLFSLSTLHAHEQITDQYINQYVQPDLNIKKDGKAPSGAFYENYK